MFCCISLLVAFLASALTAEDEKKYDELEGIVFIKALYKDKKYSELVKYSNLKQISNSDKGDFNFYLADSYLNLQKFDLAEKYFNEAIHFKITESSLYYLSLSKLKFAKKQFGECVVVYENVNKWIMNYEDWKRYSTCLENNQDIDKLVSTYLNYNISDFDYVLEAQRILLKYGLREIAKDKREEYFSNCKSIDDFLAMFNLMEDAKVKDHQLKELAHRCHPKSLEISSHLIKEIFQKDYNHSIANLFFELSIDDIAFRKHASEFYKASRRSEVAYYFATISDESTYVLSRAERSLNQENMALLFSLKVPNNLLSTNKDLSYAKAFAALKYLQLDTVDAILKNIPKKNTKEEQLAALVSKCKEFDYKCRP